MLAFRTTSGRDEQPSRIAAAVFEFQRREASNAAGGGHCAADDILLRQDYPDPAPFRTLNPTFPGFPGR